MEPTVRQPQRVGWLGRNWGCLVPIGLICLVAAYIASVWQPLPPEQVKKQETLNRQMRLLRAIEAYRKTTGEAPDVVYNPASVDPDKSDPARHMASLLTTLRGENDQSPVREATKAMLGDDPKSLTRDVYGNAMLYLKDKGVGGKPVIISAGADGVFGYEKHLSPEQGQRYKKDNIRSDTSN